MCPAHERFHADDTARRQIDLGLKMQDDLAALVRAAQLVGQIQIQHRAHESPSIPRSPARTYRCPVRRDESFGGS